MGILVGVTSELSLNLMVPGRRTGAEEVGRGERKSPGRRLCVPGGTLLGDMESLLMLTGKTAERK